MYNRRMDRKLKYLIGAVFIFGFLLWFFEIFLSISFFPKSGGVGLAMFAVIAPICAVTSAFLVTGKHNIANSKAKRDSRSLSPGLIFIVVGVLTILSGALSSDQTLAPLGNIIIGISIFFVGTVLLVFGVIKKL